MMRVLCNKPNVWLEVYSAGNHIDSILLGSVTDIKTVGKFTTFTFDDGVKRTFLKSEVEYFGEECNHEDAIEQLLQDINDIAEYYKLHGKIGDYDDLKNALDRYNNNR